MRTSAAFAFTLASASYVLAQNSTFSTDGLNASPSCSGFLTSLNSDSTIQSCLNSLVDATGDFDSANGGSNSGSVQSALDNMCSPLFASKCDETYIRGKLVDFYAACSSDMAGADGAEGNKQIIGMYDTLYLVVPLKNAVCAKSDDGNYCINQIGSVDASPSQNTTGQTPLTPNLEAYRDTGLPYLFLTPESDPTRICSDCAGKVLGSYVRFETVCPYALGIANSLVLSGQPGLWEKVQQCDNGLANAILANNTGASNQSGATDVHVGMTSVVVSLMSVALAAFALL